MNEYLDEVLHFERCQHPEHLLHHRLEEKKKFLNSVDRTTEPLRRSL